MKKWLSTYLNFSADEYELFIAQGQLKHYKKQEHILFADRAVDKLFFVKSGVIRGYRILDGEDITHHFFLENWFATDFESYLTGNKGELYAEALVDTTVYEFNKSRLESFYKNYPEFEKIRAILAEAAYLKMVDRMKNFQTNDLKDRYKNLIQKNPALFQSVPQKHIASYLGVAPQSLSRIKEV